MWKYVGTYPMIGLRYLDCLSVVVRPQIRGAESVVFDIFR